MSPDTAFTFIFLNNDKTVIILCNTCAFALKLMTSMSLSYKSMEKIQRVRRKDTRADEIIACATTLFLNEGYEGTNFSDIAQCGNMARSTIYLYFKDKQDLLRACIKKRFSLNKSLFLSILEDKSICFEVRMSSLLSRLKKMFEDETSRRFYVMVASLSAKYPDIARIWLEEVLLPMRSDWNEMVAELDFKDEYQASMLMIIFSGFLTSCFMSVSFGADSPLMEFSNYCDFIQKKLLQDKLNFCCRTGSNCDEKDLTGAYE